MIFSFNTGFAADKHLHLGVYPHLSAEHVDKIFSPMVKLMADAIGVEIRFDPYLDLKHFPEKLRQGRYDIVFVQPFDYVKINKAHAYQPLASQNKDLQASIVVKPNRNIFTIEDLRGRTVMLPHRNTAVSYLVREFFHQRGFNENKDIFFKYDRTHLSCIQRIIFGFADACGVVNGAVEFFVSMTSIDLRVVDVTPASPHALFAVHPKVDKSYVMKMKNVLTRWSKTKPALAHLQQGRMVDFRPVLDSEYNSVRAIIKRVDSL